jgi:hypothetical protein
LPSNRHIKYRSILDTLLLAHPKCKAASKGPFVDKVTAATVILLFAYQIFKGDQPHVALQWVQILKDGLCSRKCGSGSPSDYLMSVQKKSLVPGEYQTHPAWTVQRMA